MQTAPARLLRLLTTTSLLLLAFTLGSTPAAHAAAAPAGAFGVGGWQWPTTTALDRESAHGLKTWRVALDFGTVEANASSPQWSGFDNLVLQMAARKITPLFVLTGCPARDCPAGGPPTSAQAVADWTAFVSAAVARYGSTGTLWSTHPTVAKYPVQYWQVRNEVNGAAEWPNPSPTAYAALLATTAKAIRAADPLSKVVLAGLPQNMTISMHDYLTALYRVAGFKTSFDIVAIHGYAPTPQDTWKILDDARTIMVAAGDSAKPLWVTEMGWATAGPAHPFVVSSQAQATDMAAAWSTMVACSSRWNLGRTYWYGWQDPASISGSDYWGYHTGVEMPDGTAKPALAVVDAYTSGATLPSGQGASCTLPGGSTIDSTPPETTITSGPAAYVPNGNVTYRFASSEAGVQYQCQFDGAAWAACTPDASGNWKPATVLGNGTHTLSVRAIDPSGNVDPTPATQITHVDIYPPDTYVAGTWGDVAFSHVALTLTASEPTSGYQCKVDAGAWAACTSPFKATLALGFHSISVRAVDLAGNVDPDPAAPWYHVLALN